MGLIGSSESKIHANRFHLRILNRRFKRTLKKEIHLSFKNLRRELGLEIK